MGNTSSDLSSPGGIWDIWERDDDEEARLCALTREAAGGNDTTGVSVTGADGVNGADADVTGATGVSDGTGAPVGKHNWAAANTKASTTGRDGREETSGPTKASGDKDLTARKEETTGSEIAGRGETTGGSGICVAGTTVGRWYGSDDMQGCPNNDDVAVWGWTEAGLRNGSEAAVARDDSGNAGPLPEGFEAKPEVKRNDKLKESDLDQCGLPPDPNGEWEEAELDPRIKESLLTPEEKTKFQGLLKRIFAVEALRGMRVDFDPDDIVEVANKVIPYLESEPMLIEDLPFDITIVGDLHGQLHDLHRMFHGDEKDGKPGWGCMKYLFLGNYVDRGRQSLETVMALYCIKMLYPDRIFLLRGNHEFCMTNSRHGFAFDFSDRFTLEDTWKGLYYKINESFCYLSAAAIVGNTYFCAHAGISLHGLSRRRILGIRKPIMDSREDLIVHDLVWSDPANGLRGATFNGQRQTSMYFGVDELSLGLHCVDCAMLVRGHTMIRAGYELIGNLCLSLFTASGASDEMNDGAVAVVDADGKVSLRILECDPKRVAWDQTLKGVDGGCADINDKDDGKTANVQQ